MNSEPIISLSDNFIEPAVSVGDNVFVQTIWGNVYGKVIKKYRRRDISPFDLYQVELYNGKIMKGVEDFEILKKI